MIFRSTTTFFKGNWILILIPILIFFGLHYILEFNGLYGQDSHEYLRFSKELKDAFGQSNHEFSEFYWPKGYPVLGALMSYTGLSVLSALRFVSLLSLILTLIYTRKIIFLLFNAESNWFLILGAVTQVYFIRSGLLVMSDSTAMCFVVLTFYFYLKFIKDKKTLFFLAILLFFVLSVFCRYASVPLVFLPLFHGAFLFLKKFNLWLAIGIILFLGIGISFFVYSNNHLFEYGIHVDEYWNFRNIFSRTLSSKDGTTYHLVPNILYVFGNFLHLGFLSIGVLIIPFYKRIKKENWIFLVSLLLYFILLIGMSIQNYRFLVLSHPLVLIILFPAVLELKNFLVQRKLFVWMMGFGILFNIGLFYYSFNKTYRVFKLEKQVVKYVKALNEKTLIYTFYVDQSFRSYGITNEVKNFYFEEYEYFEKGALVIFNEEKFKSQWDGTNVMENWNKLNSDYELELIEELSQNWKIYRIK